MVGFVERGRQSREPATRRGGLPFCGSNSGEVVEVNVEVLWASLNF